MIVIVVMIISLFISCALFGLAILLYVRLERALRAFKIHDTNDSSPDLPSVSVCIPARNETHAMTQCLERVLASDYKKMEVLVYDDESGDDTSILIKSFAHAGVRFVSGPVLPQDWLGKNHALEVLAREASGSYVIFLDVDTHINTTTISRLMNYVTANNLVMASVIPGRNDVRRASVIFGHLRYFWQLLLARKNHPATSSSLWMIKRHVFLDTIGGFAPHKAKVEPETHIAAIIGTTAYRCLISDATLGVCYEKRWQSQRETSRRLLYPMVGGTWRGAFLGLLILALLNMPFFLILSGVFMTWSTIHTIAAILLGVFGLIYVRYTHVIWRRHWWLGVVVWPIVVLQELLSFIASVYGYARGTITWKGRPVMTPRLANQVAEPANQ